MRKLALAGRSIRWPNVCPCCLGDADTTVKLDHTVTSTSTSSECCSNTTTTTTRHDTRSWDVAYCRGCLAHIHATRELHNFTAEAGHPSWVVGGLGVTVWLVTWLVVAGGTGVPSWLPHAVGIGGLVLLVLLVWLTYPLCAARYRRAVAEMNERRADLKARADADLCSSCSSPARLAVRYHGWREKKHYGGEWSEEWHTFSFESDEFADLISTLNETRRVED